MAEFEKTMMMVSAEYNKKPSFKLIPMSKDAPFIDGMYIPQDGQLILFSKSKKEKPHMMVKLNSKGIPMFHVVSEEGKKEHKPVEERVMFEAYYDYYITNKDDIKMMLETIVFNQEHEGFKLI